MLPADPLAASFDEGVSCYADKISNFENWPIHLLVLRHQLAEMGHGTLPVTHTYTSNERQPLLRSTHAKRSTQSGFVQTRCYENALTSTENKQLAAQFNSHPFSF
jgi:hypothetical protein